MSKSYDDIINLPHHVSTTRPQMSIENRAAQFAPFAAFAALTGYDAAIKETARLTDKRIELSENSIDELSIRLQILTEMIDIKPEVAITYFQPDDKKDGGTYVTVIGEVKKIDDYEGIIILMNGEKIVLEDIFDIECKLFKDLI